MGHFGVKRGGKVPMGLNEERGWTARWSPMRGFTLDPINMRDAGVFFCEVVPSAEDDLKLMVMVDAARWDPRRGFLLGPELTARFGDVSGTYTCVAEGGGGRGGRAEAARELLVLLLVSPRSTNLAPPRVHPVNALPHAVLGKDMELQCYATVMAHVLFSMEWLVPANSTAKEEGRLNATNATVHFDAMGSRIGSTNLTIVNVTENDAGAYTCLLNDHSKKAANTTFVLEVRDANVSFIDVNIPSPEALHQRVGLLQTATWTLEVVTYPTSPTISWFTPAGSPLTAVSAAKFQLRKLERGKGLELTLSVLDVELSDRGTYALKINTGAEEKTVNLTLTVRAAPLVQLQAPPEPWPLGATRKVSCTAIGSPLPTVQWAWHPCPGLLRNCAPDDASFKTVWLRANSSGFITCRAANELDDSVNDTVSLQVTDMPGARTLEAWGPEPEPAVEGDDLRLWCGALRENHTDWPHWRRSELWDDKRFQMTRSNTSLSLRSQLRINPASVADSGSYLCFLDELEETTVEYKLDVKPQRNVFPRDVNMNNTVWMANTRDKLTLRCNFDGLPRPTISWFKDSEPFALPLGGEQFRLQDGNKTLVIGFVTEADQGEYRCRAANRVHSEERWVRVQLLNRKGITDGMVALIVVLVVLLLTVVPLFLFVYKDWKRRRMLISGLHHFAEGQPDVLNPELPADEQAELLPYDRKWEFPRERLKLGKQLGAGAFGVVLKAEAQGIVEGEEVTTVAVKMVKRTANFSYLKALASELKIMVHLGRHLNVVNLLGACTGNIQRQELLVIVEYCRFGNLHNYLLRHREGFVDQVDPRTGAVDAAIGADRLARADSFSHCGPGGRVKYASLSFSGSSDTTGGSDAGSEAGAPCPWPRDYARPPPPAAAAAGGGTSVCIDSAGHETISMSPAGDEAGLTSNGSAQPHWRSNYRGDYRGVRLICTRDLLCWAYQVARGMQYLARRKVLHGDLAARNILLADGNIVKICDFGLAKSMYKSDNYKKKGDGPLPVKWMALESIRDGVFSTQSDVWSFGIVLWELFSLAQTPYPGMEADERLYNKLQDGYRMERPPYATQDLYRVMLRCWEANPVRRPPFDELADGLGAFLEESVRNHYLDLNNAYIDMNEQWQRDGATDYLGMLGAPDYSNLVAPREDDDPDYINSLPGVLPPSPSANSGYLLMRGGAPLPGSGSTPATPRSAEVFSPRPGSGAQVFTFAGPRAPAAAAGRHPPPQRPTWSRAEQTRRPPP
ncbi:Protein sevenless [Gryllus bimaculatus]|nr:Protein sevenless [Gryllus bimaculatus]